MPALPERRVRAGSRTRASAAQAVARAAPIFAALGDENRLRIVARLCGSGPLSIVRIADGAKVSRQAVTKHLHALEQAGIARSSRAGRERIWELLPQQLSDVRRYLDQISHDWDATLGRLRTFVED